MNQKTTAKVEHRDYIPWGWIAIPFCRVTFHGKEADEMDKKWREITHARFVEYDEIVTGNEQRISNLENDIQNLQKEIKKPWYRPWYNATEKQKMHQIQGIRNEIERINLQLVEDKKKRFYESYEYRTRLESLLNKNGFYLTNTSSSGEECVTHTEIWTKD